MEVLNASSSVTPSPVGKGRKKQRNPENYKRNVDKRMRYVYIFLSVLSTDLFNCYCSVPGIYHTRYQSIQPATMMVGQGNLIIAQH